MSEMEHRKGTLKEIQIPCDCFMFVDQLQHIQTSGYSIDEYDVDDKYVYSSEVAYLNGKWFEIKETLIDPYDGFAKAALKRDQTIEFDCKWYNGGASFHEVLEMALKKLEEF